MKWRGSPSLAGDLQSSVVVPLAKTDFDEESGNPPRGTIRWPRVYNEECIRKI